MTTSVIYARQSKDNAEGIDRQLDRCRKLAEVRGWTVSAEYEDNALSASKARGTGSAWSRMLADPTEVVIAVDLDRLLRSQRDLLALMDAGKKVVTVNGEIDLASASGEMQASVMAAVARHEVRRKAERQTRAAEHRRAGGLPIAGKRRYGFMAAGDGRKGNMVEHPEEGPALRDMFEKVARGVPTHQVAREAGLNVTTFNGMIRNRAYIGEIRHGKDWYHAAPEVARIVPLPLWDAVQAILADPARKTSPGMQVRHVASGLVACGVCGQKLNAKGVNYFCPAEGSHPSIRRFILNDRLCWEVFTYLSAEPQGAGGDILALEESLAELEAERTELSQDLTIKGVDKTVIRKRLRELDAEANSIIESIQAQRAEHVAAEVVAEVRQALRSEVTDQEGAEWWEQKWNQLPLEVKRELVRGLDVRVYRGRGPERVVISPR